MRKIHAGRARNVVVVMALLAVMLPSSFREAAAVTRTVKNTKDSGPGSLRAAIAATKAGDTIKIPASKKHYKVTSGQLEISKPLTIKGAGAKKTVIDAQQSDRVFDIVGGVPAGKAVTFIGVTITGGFRDVSGGGGIFVDETVKGNLVLRKTVVTKNTVNVDEGTQCCRGGGGIYNDGTGKTILIGSSIIGNKATVTDTGACCHGGGGIFLGDENDLVSKNSKILKNKVIVTGPAIDGPTFSICCSGGGGIYQGDDGHTKIVKTTFTKNTATIEHANCCHGGGALYLSESDPDPTIKKSSFTRNKATVTGPFLDDTGTGQNHCCHGGGAIYSQQTLDISSTKFKSNKAIVESGNCCHGGGALVMAAEEEGTTIVGTTFTGNNASIGGPAADAPNDPHCCNGGGAIFSFGDIEVERTKLTANTADVDAGDCCHGGGAIMSFAFTLLGEATLANNTFQLVGGACCNGGGGIQIDSEDSLVVIESSILGNQANFTNPGGDLNGGGGIYEDNSSNFYYNSTISGNSTDISDSVNPNQGGGGIYELLSGTDQFFNVTIAGNSAPLGAGGGVFSAGSTLETRNSIFALNTSDGGPNCDGEIHNLNPPTFTSFGYNLEDSSDSCAFSGTGDQTVDANLIGLTEPAKNGGPTLTRALMLGSPAINAGDPAGCKDDEDDPLVVDQRGVARPQGPECDIGAFEFNRPKLTVAIKGKGKVTSVPAGIDCPGDCAQPFDHATIVTLKRKASNGSHFVKWTGACSGSGSCLVEMLKPAKVVAKFAEN